MCCLDARFRCISRQSANPADAQFEMKKSVLITGGAGYVGSVLVRQLLADGYHVTCIDRLSFGGEALLDVLPNPSFAFRHIDLNDFDAVERVLTERSYYAILHLAAIVGDPACAREPDEARRTNWTAAKNLVDRARAHGVGRFVFASTCSNYGKMADSTSYVDENSALAPVSLYAELKVRFERYILEEMPKSDDFAPTALRFSTVYGLSPRMRFDLTVNEFTKDMATGKGLKIYGAQFWRPYCHVRDFARAYTAVLAADMSRIAYDVFNVGDTSENYTKGMLVDQLVRIFPNAPVSFVEKVEDPRDYRVNCDKIRDRLGFKVTLRVPDGIGEIAQIVTQKIISNPNDQRYYNVPYSG
jgi:nucleoside-diphosphate-sugar epimerase